MCKKLLCLLAFIFFSAQAMAGISLDSTRVIFLEKNAKQGQSVGVTSSRESETPYLVSAQIVNSPEGDNTNSPFVVSPSLFRLEPGTTNQLRIMQVPGKALLPRDKESIFYLRVIAQPSGKNKDQSTENHLGGAVVVSTASIIKVMYRPAGLSVSQKQSMKNLAFTYRDGKLTVSNPTPYFVSLASLRLGDDKVPLSVQKQNTMIAPYSSHSYSVHSTGNTLTWKAINDYGGTEEFKGVLE